MLINRLSEIIDIWDTDVEEARFNGCIIDKKPREKNDVYTFSAWYEGTLMPQMARGRDVVTWTAKEDSETDLLERCKTIRNGIEQHYRDIKTLEAIYRRLEDQIQTHLWVLECGGSVTYVGTREEVWQYAKERGQIPLDDDSEDGCQFADHPMIRGIPKPVWGTATKIKPTTQHYNWTKLVEMAKHEIQNRDQER